ncbi:hypothetical protein TYRP_021003 [Tyrophagus putrescentiae]|nr:hypothetical protein TYRP_021003 [Tyrophagus putrescentiae]
MKSIRGIISEEQCEENCSTLEELFWHHKNVHFIKRYRCFARNCENVSFDSEESLDMHFTNFHKDGAKCKVCFESYNSLHTLQYHYQFVHQKGLFKCTGCDKLYMNSTHTVETPATVDLDNATMPNSERSCGPSAKWKNRLLKTLETTSSSSPHPLLLLLLLLVSLHLHNGARLRVEEGGVSRAEMAADVLDGDQTGQAELPGDDRPVADSAADFGDDAADQRKIGRPANVGGVGEQDVPGLDVHRLLDRFGDADTGLHRADGDGGAAQADGPVGHGDHLGFWWLKRKKKRKRRY